MVAAVMGPIALHFYFPELPTSIAGMERLGERGFTDIDYAAYGKHRGPSSCRFSSLSIMSLKNERR